MAAVAVGSQSVQQVVVGAVAVAVAGVGVVVALLPSDRSHDAYVALRPLPSPSGSRVGEVQQECRL